MHFLIDSPCRASSQPILFLYYEPGPGRNRFWVSGLLLATYYPMTSKTLQIKYRHQGISVHSTPTRGPLPTQQTFRAGKVKNRHIVRLFHVNEGDIINEILGCVSQNSDCFVWAFRHKLLRNLHSSNRKGLIILTVILFSVFS